MKKILFLGLAGALTLASCSSDDLFGEQTIPGHKDSGEISFGSKIPGMTRADGATAAAKLGNSFNVYGVKTTGNQIEETFKDYVVRYDNGRWDYASIDNGTEVQTIKYWDPTANHYDFFAWGYGNNTKGTANVSHTYTTNAPTFTVNAGNAKDLANVYVADKETRPNNDNTKPMTGQVALTFKSMGAKVRMAFFEVIPGYRVYITGVYTDQSATTAATDKTNFFLTATDANVGFPTGQTSYTVDYANFSSASALKDLTTAAHSKTLSFGNAEIFTPVGGIYDKSKAIGISVTTATSTEGDGKIGSETGGAYTCVYPMPENALDLHLRIAYTMEAEDLSAEKQPRTAHVVIPHEYVQWKPNYAYSYLFKLTDSELDPITFDAIVLDETDGTQETVTKIDKDDTYSITTSQPGLVSNAMYNFFVSGHPFDIRVESKDGVDQNLNNGVLKIFHAIGTTHVIESSAAAYCTDATEVSGNEAVTISTDNKTASFTPHGIGCYIVRFAYTAGSETKYSYKVLNVAQYTIANLPDHLQKNHSTETPLELHMNYSGTPETLSEATFTSSETTLATINNDNTVHAHETGVTIISAKLGDTVIATQTLTVTE